MTNKQGFTLVEILLAVMIIGIIGVALAAVTSAALRESGVGRTRMILRNQLSVAVRQLRQDIQLAETVSASGSTLTLTFNNGKKAGPTIPTNLPTLVEYTFTPGTEVAPGNTPGATIGGQIFRTADGNTEVWLENVKKIANYPSFELVGNGTGDGKDSRVRVRIIVQSNAFPVVNEAFDETFITPHGIGSCDPCAISSSGCSGGVSCN